MIFPVKIIKYKEAMTSMGVSIFKALNFRITIFQKKITRRTLTIYLLQLSFLIILILKE
jgi:hypothetical protein